MSQTTHEIPQDHKPIASFLELEQLDTHSFLRDSLWRPQQERGVFGGQLIGQALLAATRSVSVEFSANSIHCHFLSSADPSQPISYSVEPMRRGKTYCTMMVKGQQNQRWVFSAICSFQRPEFGQPTHWQIMPPDVPPPDECVNQEDVFRKGAEQLGVAAEGRYALLGHAEQLGGFPIAVKTATSRPISDDLTEDIFWMRIRAMPDHDVRFRKCVLAFLSDWGIIFAAARAVGLYRGLAPPNRLAMASSLDHSVWFYDNEFDCTEWMMFAMVSPLVGMGRGIVHGRIYTQRGDLIAVITQEGVVRAQLNDRSNALARL